MRTVVFLELTICRRPILFEHNCTVFEIIDGTTLEDGKLKVLEGGSHEYVVVTCAVSFEFKSRDEIKGTV